MPASKRSREQLEAEELRKACKEAFEKLGCGRLSERKVSHTWFGASAEEMQGRNIRIYGAKSEADALEQLLAVLLVRIGRGYGQ